MRYALNIGDDGRVLSVTYEEYGTQEMPVVDSVPDGNASDYLYVDGSYVYDPVPAKEEEPSEFELMQAQILYTAIMTDTLIED